MSNKDDLKCPRCGHKKVNTDGLKDKLKQHIGAGLGLGVAGALLNVAALPILAGYVGYDILSGETVECAGCGHEWVIG